MKHEIIPCEASVIIEWSDGKKTLEACRAIATYKMEDGRSLCSSHARVLFTEHALSAGYAKRMFGDPKNNYGPQYVFDTPDNAKMG